MKGKGNGKGGNYESHTSVADITVIFADTGLVLVKRIEASPLTLYPYIDFSMLLDVLEKGK